MEISMEDIVMKLIVNAGQARTKAIQALREARACKFEKAEELMKESEEVVNLAHEFQSELLRDELDEKKSGGHEVNLIMVHGQDHLMDAITVREMAREMINLCRQLHEKQCL